MLRFSLLVPCLLICFSCATPVPFPIESLEEGMTKETVRETFGDPVAANTVWNPPGGGNFLRGNWTYNADSSWTYVDEERNWVYSVMFSLLLPFQITSSVIGALVYSGDDDFRWDWAYVERKPVVLYFEQEELVSGEQEKLARWEVIKPTYPAPDDDLFSDTDDWDWMDQSKGDAPRAKERKRPRDRK